MAIIPLSVFLLRWSTLKTEISNQTEGFVILNAKSRKRGWCGLGCQVRSLSQSLRVALKSGQQCKRCEPLLTSHHCGSSILIDSCQTHVPSMAAECIQPLHRIRPPLWSVPVPLSSGHSGFSSLHWANGRQALITSLHLFSQWNRGFHWRDRGTPAPGLYFN